MSAPIFIQQLKQGKTAAIEALYRAAYPSCAAMILAKQGNQEDAQDIFQESLLVLFKKLQQPDFELHISPEAYIYGICRNLWLKTLQKNKRNKAMQATVKADVDFLNKEEVNPLGNVFQKQVLVAELLKEMGVACRSLLMGFYFQQRSLKELANQLNYSSKFIKIKKKRCLDHLKERVIQAYQQRGWHL